MIKESNKIFDNFGKELNIGDKITTTKSGVVFVGEIIKINSKSLLIDVSNMIQDIDNKDGLNFSYGYYKKFPIVTINFYAGKCINRTIIKL